VEGARVPSPSHPTSNNKYCLLHSITSQQTVIGLQDMQVHARRYIIPPRIDIVIDIDMSYWIPHRFNQKYSRSPIDGLPCWSTFEEKRWRQCILKWIFLFACVNTVLLLFYCLLFCRLLMCVCVCVSSSVTKGNQRQQLFNYSIKWIIWHLVIW